MKDRLFDAHIHLDQYPEDKLARYIPQWQQQGVQGVLAVSTNLASCYQTLQLKQQYPDFIHAALGFHPEQRLADQKELDEICNLIKLEGSFIAAIGEVGLPYYLLKDNLDLPLSPYFEVLHRFAALSADTGLPIVLHAVHDQAKLALNILEEHQVQLAHFHWLKAPIHVVKDIVSAGYFVSITPEVCYRERDQELLRAVPLNHLLLETDGPWPYSGEFRQTETTPLLLHRVAEKVSELLGISTDRLIQQCRRNLCRLLPAFNEDE